MRKLALKTKASAFAAICIFGLANCAKVDSDQVAPAVVVPAYSARFDEEAHTLSFIARFQVGNGVGGTGIQLSKASSVRVNETPLKYTDEGLNRVSYQYIFTNVPSAVLINKTYSFIYVDNANRTFTNAITIPQPVKANIPPSFNRAAGFDIPWQATEPLIPGESVAAYLTPAIAEAPAARTQEVSTLGNSGKIGFNQNAFQNTVEAQVKVTICRERFTTQIQSAESGGSLSVVSCAAGNTEVK